MSKRVKRNGGIVEDGLGLGWVNLSKVDWYKLPYKEIVDVGHEGYRHNSALQRFELVLSIHGKANWLAKSVVAFDPVEEAMPAFVFLSFELGRFGSLLFFGFTH